MFAEKYGPWAVIAGGSDGTGSALARGIAARGVSVVLVARRAEVLEQTAEAIRAEHGVEVRTVVLDLSRDEAAAELEAAVGDLEVGLFVYNAGADLRSVDFLAKPVDEHLAMVRRNCSTVLDSTYRFGRAMVERGHGGVILVTSGAGWAGGAHLVTYAASKAFDLILAEGLWAEWRGQGVDVLSLVLSATDTPSYHRNAEAKAAYPQQALVAPEQVAAEALEHLADGPTWLVGGGPNPASPFGPMPRRDAVLLMSGAKA